MVYWCASTAQSFFAFLYEKKSSQKKRVMVKCFFKTRSESTIRFFIYFFIKIKSEGTVRFFFASFFLFVKKKGSYAIVSSIARETAWRGASPAETRLYSSYIKSAMRCVS